MLTHNDYIQKEPKAPERTGQPELLVWQLHLTLKT